MPTRKPRPRQFNLRGYINETLAREIAGQRGPRHTRQLFVGIDEGLNNDCINDMCRRLVQTGVAHVTSPLWYARRIKADGEFMNVLGGSIAPSSLVTDVGRIARGSTWPDENVVALAVANLSTMNVCILTSNTRNDANGLRRILQTEVRPALEGLKHAPVGVLVLAQAPGTSLAAYAAAVEKRLRSGRIEEVFEWLEIPS